MGALRSQLRQSLYSLLRSDASRKAGERREDKLEEIREAMLTLIGDTMDYPILVRRIRYAETFESLWYVRGDLMMALSALLDEQRARRHVADVTRMFRGMLPEGLMARRSPLN